MRQGAGSESLERLADVCVLCCFFQAEDGIRDVAVTGVQTCALPISLKKPHAAKESGACGSRSATIRRAGGWEVGTINESLGRSRALDCHAPSSATRKRPSNGAWEKVAVVAMNASTEAFGTGCPSRLK